METTPPVIGQNSSKGEVDDSEPHKRGRSHIERGSELNPPTGIITLSDDRMLRRKNPLRNILVGPKEFTLYKHQIYKDLHGFEGLEPTLVSSSFKTQSQLEVLQEVLSVL